MVKSTWDKQNFQIRNWGMGLTFLFILITYALPIFYPDTFGWVPPSFALLVGILGTLLTIIFMRKYPNRMLRVVLFDYEEIERDFRLLFKSNGILFYRSIETLPFEEKESYIYDFTGHKLKMLIHPYPLFDNVYKPEVPFQPATEIQLHTVTPKNVKFANRLADLVDELAIQLQEDAEG